MDQLLNPNFGVMALTVVNFLLLVWLLHKFAWKGIIHAVQSREEQIASDRQAAAQARQQAQQLQEQLDKRLEHIAAEAAQKLQEAVTLGQQQKEQLLAEAQAQTQRMVEQARVQIEAEKENALKEVRGQIADTALLAASQIAKQQFDKTVAERVVENVLQDIQKQVKQ